MTEFEEEAPGQEVADPDRSETAEVAARRDRMKTALAVILALLILLLIALGFFIFRVLAPPGRPSSKDLPSGMTWIRSIYGYGPSEGEQLYRPVDTAIGPDGTIWVTDPQSARIFGFTPEGALRRFVHSAASGQAQKGSLYAPDSVDADVNGDLYIADYGRQAILVFSQEGRFLREWAVRLPLEVDVTSDRVVVSTSSGLSIFTNEGEPLGTIGTRGRGPEQFDTPRGLVVGSDGTMYVADTHNKRVKAYSSDGKLQWIFPADAAQAAEADFQVPVGMTMDASGRLVLVDAFNFQVIVLDPEQKGRIVGRYGEFGQTDGKFVYPSGISYDRARDYFAIADTRNDRVQIVRIEGSGGGLPGALRRLFGGPFRLCALPLLLLLIALAIYVARRRRQAAAGAQEPEDDGSEAEVDA